MINFKKLMLRKTFFILLSILIVDVHCSNNGSCESLKSDDDFIKRYDSLSHQLVKLKKRNWCGEEVEVDVDALNKDFCDMLKDFRPSNSIPENRDGDYEVHIASKIGDLVPVLDWLVKNGEDINRLNKYGMTALHKAVIYGNVSTVEFLLSKNASINIKDGYGCTPIDYANKDRNCCKQVDYVAKEKIRNILKTYNVK